MLRLFDVMTRDLVTVSPDLSLRDTVDVLVANHISGAPVVEGGRLVGVVSASDLLEFEALHRPATPASTPPEDDWDDDELEEVPAGLFFREVWSGDPLPAGGEEHERTGASIDPLGEHTVAEVMTRRVWTLPPEARLDEAARFMEQAAVHRILVTERERLVGIVTTTDISRCVAHGM